jgi:hypothetical protein
MAVEHGKKHIEWKKTYAEEKWSLEETLVRLVGVVRIVFIQKNGHIRPPDF